MFPTYTTSIIYLIEILINYTNFHLTKHLLLNSEYFYSLLIYFESIFA